MAALKWENIPGKVSEKGPRRGGRGPTWCLLPYIVLQFWSALAGKVAKAVDRITRGESELLRGISVMRQW